MRKPMRTLGEITAADESLFDQFRAKAREFAGALAALKDRAGAADGLSPADREKYAALVSRGDTVMKTVRAVTGTIDGIVNWFTGVFGLGGLNAVPLLVPYAAIAAGMAAMGYFINDAVVMLRKLDLVEQGKLAPADLDAGSLTSGISGVVGKVAIVAAIGLVGYWLYTTSRSK